MEFIPCSYRTLNASDLIQDYTSDYAKLSDFYSENPFDTDAVKSFSEALDSAPVLPEKLQALEQYHKDLGIKELQDEVLQKLAEPGVQVIVTGQQLGLLGGPLYTIYKTLTAIHFAHTWSQLLNKTIIPVFWLADEDHDFDEINLLRFPGREEADTLSLPADESEKPVSEIQLKSFSELRAELEKILHETDFSTELFQLIDECYQDGKLHSSAFAQLIARIFRGQGLLIAGSQHPEIKKLFRETFKTSIKKRDEIEQKLEAQSKRIEQYYHQQVQLGSTNLFYIAENGSRLKISYDDGHYRVSDKIVFSRTELLEKIESTPECFSPNVFLRPVIQDELLPTLAYVAGPGELAYYGQMRPYYQVFGKKMPIMLPRFGFTLLETAVQKAMDSLPFDVGRYNDREEDLISEYLSKSQELDLNAFTEEWVKDVEGVSEQYLDRIEELDASLRASAEKTLAIFKGETDKLKGKLFRSQKQQEQTQIKRIRKVQSQLYPDGILQERAVSFVYFMNKYGNGIWQELLDKIREKDLQPDQHYLIHL